MREADALVRLRGHGIDAVPHGWTVSKVKYLAAYTNGYPFKPDQWGTAGKPIIRIQNLTDPSAEPNRFEGNLDECYAVEAGDFLISWSASLGLHVWQGEPAWLNQHIFRVELNGKCLPHYFRWLATWFMSELDRDAHGSTMQHLTKDAFGGFPLLLPPASAQAAIAEHLDAATAKLDSLLAEKQALLELLAEKRRALITRAVTQGINPDATRRDSGIAWLGEVPAHWALLPLRRMITSLEQGWSPVASNLPAEVGEYGVLKLSAIKGGRFLPQENKALALQTEVPANLLISKDDLFITRANTPGLVGDVAIANSDHSNLIFSDLIYRIRADNAAVSPEWLVLVLLCDVGRRQIEAEAKGSSGSMVKLAQDQVLSLVIPVPPKCEQVAINAFLQVETGTLDELAAATSRTIELLQERRAALISAAVTGQLATAPHRDLARVA